MSDGSNDWCFFIFDWSIWSFFHCATSPAHTSIIPSYSSWVVLPFFFVSLTWGCGVNVDSFIGLFLPCSLCELFFRYNSHHSYLNFSLHLSVSVTLSARVPPQWACHNLLTSPGFVVFCQTIIPLTTALQRKSKIWNWKDISRHDFFQAIFILYYFHSCPKGKKNLAKTCKNSAVVLSVSVIWNENHLVLSAWSCQCPTRDVSALTAPVGSSGKTVSPFLYFRGLPSSTENNILSMSLSGIYCGFVFAVCAKASSYSILCVSIIWLGNNVF